MIRLASLTSVLAESYTYARNWQDHWYLILVFIPFLLYGLYASSKESWDINAGRKPGVKPQNNNDFFFWWRD